MPFKRTAQCKKCGEVLFKIKPTAGKVTYICKTCNNEVATTSYDDYETLIPTCHKCGGDTFKARIIEDDSYRYWATECENCKSSPKTIYVDNHGKSISEDEREELIRQDEVGRLEEEANAKDDLIQQLENDIDDLNNEIEEKDNYIYNLKNEIEENEYNILDLRNEIREKDYLISELEDKVAGLEWKLRKLE